MRTGLRAALGVLGTMILLAALTTPAFTHNENGGTGDDELVGHDDHSDTLNGGPGCDDVKGLGQDDDLYG
jgi:hypothetical protein